MSAQVAKLWQSISSALWFLPAVLVLVGAGLAFLMVGLEDAVGKGFAESVPLAFGAGPEGARGMLSSIAGSMLGLAGITFSSTLVVLTLSASTYTPRVLRNFMSDRGNQLVLGTLLATFVYSLLVLRTVRTGNSGGEEFVPTLGVTVAVLLGLACLGAFIYFVHHIAQSIQVSTIISGVARETGGAIDHLFPEGVGEPEEEVDGESARPAEGTVIRAPESGYITIVDTDELLRLTTKRDLTLRMEKAVGEFVPEGAALALVTPRENMNSGVVEEIQSLYALGKERTLGQDVEFGFRQLVDIALKALSPGINDVTTATTCVDYLGSLLRRVATRSMPALYRYDDRGRLRVIARGPTFEGLVGLAFDQIRTAGQSQAAVMLRILAVLQDLSTVVETRERRRILLEQANLLGKAADQGVQDERDREKLNEQLQHLHTALRDVGPITTLSE